MCTATRVYCHVCGQNKFLDIIQILKSIFAIAFLFVNIVCRNLTSTNHIHEFLKITFVTLLAGSYNIAIGCKY